MTPSAHVVVIGAGIAGATTAHALALRGLEVEVWDAAPEPAAGASGLPVGLFYPHTSKDDAPLSQLSRLGVAHMLALLPALPLEPTDWAARGVLAWDDVTRPSELTRPATHAEKAQVGFGAERPALMHQGGWVAGTALVRALLAHEAIRFVGSRSITRVQASRHGLELLGALGEPLGLAQHVVLAAAWQSLNALPQELGAQVGHANTDALAGQLSARRVGQAEAGAWARFALAGSGTASPATPDNSPQSEPLMWFGSSYERSGPWSVEQAHEHNLAKLKVLAPDRMPAPGAVLAAWRGTRCTTRDRLPMVGLLATEYGASLWLNAGYGSRALSLAAVCSSWLAASVCGAAPMPTEWGQRLSPRRWA